MPTQVSLLSSSDHLEYIKDLRFKDEHILTQSVLPSVFVEYQPLPIIDDPWEKKCRKRKATRDCYNLVDEPSKGVGSNGGDNQELSRVCSAHLV